MNGVSMSLSDLDEANKRVLMFGGKGGVGKTTCAATTALHYAAMGQRTLIISSDATPSLSDIFEMEVGASERTVNGVENLLALEISSDEVMSRWKEEFGPGVYEVASSFTDMDYDDVVEYVASAPGIQEEFMLGYILERVRDGSHDMVVWDTAPAGDTLHLLNLPHKFIAHLRAAPKVYLGVRDTLQLGNVPFLELIETWRGLSEEVTTFLRDPANTEFILVTIPEALGVFQARRLVVEFARYGLHIRYLIINNLIVEPDCEFHRLRMEMQQGYVDMLVEEYRDRMKLIKLPLFPLEMKGIDRLRELEGLLFAR